MLYSGMISFFRIYAIFCSIFVIDAEICKIGNTPKALSNLPDGCTEIEGNVVLSPDLPLPNNILTEQWLEQKLSTVTKISGLLYVSNWNKMLICEMSGVVHQYFGG